MTPEEELIISWHLDRALAELRIAKLDLEELSDSNELTQKIQHILIQTEAAKRMLNKKVKRSA